jgi:hypothetical protein
MGFPSRGNHCRSRNSEHKKEVLNVRVVAATLKQAHQMTDGNLDSKALDERNAGKGRRTTAVSSRKRQTSTKGTLQRGNSRLWELSMQGTLDRGGRSTKATERGDELSRAVILAPWRCFSTPAGREQRNSWLRALPIAVILYASRQRTQEFPAGGNYPGT